MYLGERIGLVVPARDEEALIGVTLAGVPKLVDRIVVIDDGSVDATARIVLAACEGDPRIMLVHHDAPIGVGGAILAGYAALQTDGCSVLAVMAGDNQMDPADLPALLRPVCDGSADYAKGDRLTHPDVWHVMPPARLLGNLLLTWLTRRVAGYPELRDAQCGYTAMRANLVQRLTAGEVHPGYGFPNALLACIRGHGARLAQVTVRPIYGTEQSGLSAARVLRIYPGVLWRAWRSRRASMSKAAQTMLPLGDRG